VPDALGTLYESRSGLYLFSRLVPCLRLIAGASLPRGLLRKALFWLKNRELEPSPDMVFPGEMVHRSALDRLGKSAPFQKSKQAKAVPVPYEPANLRAATGRLPVVGHDGEVEREGAPVS